MIWSYELPPTAIYKCSALFIHICERWIPHVIGITPRVALPPVDVAFEHAELLQDLHGNSAGTEIVYACPVIEEVEIRHTMDHRMHVWYNSILPEKEQSCIMRVG